MGQQQLLLIILVTILVGLVTIVAINTMQEARTNSNIEALKIEIMEAATIAQGYYRKSSSMGGGEKSFNNITLKHIQLDSLTENATYSISSTADNSFTIVAIPASGGDNIEAVVFADRIEFQE